MEPPYPDTGERDEDNLVEVEPSGPVPVEYRCVLGFAIFLVLAFLAWSLWSGSREHSPAEAPVTQAPQ